MSRRLTAAIVALGVTSVASVARADEPRGVDWGRLIVGLDHLARTGSESSAIHAPPSPMPRTASDDPSPQNLGNAWFGVAPRVTLVARDWASSTRLAGDRLSVVDAVRLSASTRMVVGRARLSNARFAPFVQIGMGQWRVDRRYLPFTPSSIEIASQLGTGFELQLTPYWQLAAETAVTSLIKEGYTPGVPQLILWSSFVASRIEF